MKMTLNDDSSLLNLSLFLPEQCSNEKLTLCIGTLVKRSCLFSLSAMPIMIQKIQEQFQFECCLKLLTANELQISIKFMATRSVLTIDS